jgi:hexosaminidase
LIPRPASILLLLVAALAADAGAQTPLPLIPYPQTVIRNTDEAELARRIRLEAPRPGSLRALGAYTSDLLNAELGWRPEIVSGPSRPAGLILKLTLPDSALGSEGYRLSSQTSGVVIEAPTQAGLFHGLQTFRQLLHAGAPGTVPRVEILDAPRFPYRGMHLDVARHFFPVAFVERYIDLLSRYKFNTFHWHLTDDQGWRIQINRYPKLTEVGSCRRETVVERNFDPYIGDSTRYCGFYTQAEIRQVVAYAAARHITIIPEIEMPGHSQAAIAAYPELACTPGPFEVSTVWGVDEDILCPSEATFAFLEGVLTEVMALFPGPYIHIGGDEAPKARWKSSDLAQGIIQREQLADEHALQSWFIQRIERFLSAHGRRLIGWDEILEGGLAPGATVMSWRGVSGGIAAAQQGHDVIMTPTSHAYFDYAQGEPGLEPFSIGGNVPLERVYAFEPVPSVLTPEQASHVLGAQGNVWTEYMKTPDRVEWMVFPRMLAMAEVTWSPASARDWERFVQRLPAALAALDQLGVNYRVPNVLGLERSRLTLADTAIVSLRSPLPDGQVRYTLDGTMPTATSALYTGPLTIPVDTAGTVVTAAVFLASGASSPPRQARVSRTTLRPAARAPSTPLTPGLRLAYYEASFPSARAVANIAPTRITAADAVALPGFQRAETYGLLFTGYLRVEQAGLYTIALTSDDGSVLEIGGRVVVDNDGWHSEAERSGMVALEAGIHPMTIRYVQGSGGAVLSATIAFEGEPPVPLAGASLAQ